MGIDWRMGAEWFETCLLDYDPCSNYGNWTYGAGDSLPYSLRFSVSILIGTRNVCYGNKPHSSYQVLPLDISVGEASTHFFSGCPPLAHSPFLKKSPNPVIAESLYEKLFSVKSSKKRNDVTPYMSLWSQMPLL